MMKLLAGLKRGDMKLSRAVAACWRMDHVAIPLAALMAILAVLAMGCGTTQGAAEQHPGSADGDTLDVVVPEPVIEAEPEAPAAMTNTPGGALADADAVIRPGLVVNVTVVAGGKKQIEESGRRISEAGTLTLPLLGALTVQGETLDVFSARLAEGYREFFVNPQVMVDFVRDDFPEGISPWGHVTVLGRIKRPGRVNIPPTRDLTISAAIQRAGGFDTSAKDTAILVTRREADGRTLTREINLRAVGARGRVENDLPLQADDVVYVPQLIF